MLKCKIMTAVAMGDALCVTGYDDVGGIPQVSKAIPAVLASSRTILGVAQGDGSPGDTEEIWVAGDVAPQGTTSQHTGYRESSGAPDTALQCAPLPVGVP
jgi:hypothetical protein